MTRLITMLLLITISSVALSTTLYRWVDDEGQVHFSDQPQKGAKEITVRSPSTFESPTIPASRPTVPQEQPEAFKYDSLAVVNPTSEQTLWNIAGSLSVSIALKPGLRRGHKLQAHLNGKAIDVGNSSSFTLTDVFRGEQNLSVSVSNDTGKELIRSSPIKFFVQQTRVNRAP